MEKLKHIFRPGGEQDDQVMYGTPEPKNVHAKGGSHDHEDVGPAMMQTDPSSEVGKKKDTEGSLPTERTGASGPSGDQLRTDEGVDKNDHGIARQILNPSGDKYDEQRYGTTARSDEPFNAKTTGTGLDDPLQRTGASSTAPQLEPLPASEDKGGMLGQVLNPGGDKYDEQRYGGTANPIPGTTLSRMKEQGAMDSSMSIKSGVRGPYAGQADDHVVGAGAGNTGSSAMSGSALPDRTAQGTSGGDSHLGRDAALGGAAATGLGAAGYEEHKHHNQPSQSAYQEPSDPAAATSTERSFPLSGGATSAQTSDPAQRYGTDEAMRQDPSTASQSHLGRDAGITSAGALGLGAGGLAHERRNEEPSRSGTSGALGDSNISGDSTGGHSHLGRDAGITSAGALGLGAGELAHERRSEEPSRSGTSGGISGADIPGDSAGFHQPGEKPYEGYVHHMQGPHATDIANLLDPHVPGEFPTESGEDPHKSHLGRDAALGGAGVGAAGLGAAGHEADKTRDQPSELSAAEPATSSSSRYPDIRSAADAEVPQGSHLGRDAAIGGAGLGAAGLAGHEAGKSRDESATYPSVGGERYPVQSSPNTISSAPTATQGDQFTEPQHHYGRDTALAGGAGAAGLGAYEATKGRHEPSTSSAVDPSTGDSRYPTGATSGSTTGPSEMSTEPQHHYGRDTALAGGAGAAGIGAYEATKDRGDTGPASKTIGPHDSNIKNIVDPRVKPEPEKMKDQTTAGPYKSNMANKLDSNVESDPARAAEKQQHHYGRDAALAGGAGAAGLGTYEATKDRGDENTAPLQQDAAQHHEHNKLHKKNDPRGQHMDDKHEKDLQKAREEQAAKGGDHGEKKEGFLHKLLHRGDKDKDKEEEPKHSKHAAAPAAAGAGAAAVGSHSHHQNEATGSAKAGDDGIVIEPHTGLPMNVGKYGTYGAGGTDGAQQIEGYHETDPSLRQATHGTADGDGHHAGEEGVAGPDWDQIKKANTPY